MNFSQIRDMDISNGIGIGVSLFVQGCHFHCKNCFNSETWDFNGGKPWTSDIEQSLIELLDRPFIKRLSILGGEPLADENVETTLNILKHIKQIFGSEKKVWLYTGYTWEEITASNIDDSKKVARREAMMCTDVLVDGRFEYDKLDLTLPFRGSYNQRIIDVNESLIRDNLTILQL